MTILNKSAGTADEKYYIDAITKTIQIRSIKRE